MNMHRFQQIVSRVFPVFVFLLWIFGCADTKHHQWIETRQLKEEPVSSLVVGTDKDVLIAGDRTLLSVSGMVGSHVRDLSHYVKYHVRGNGRVISDGVGHWYVSSPKLAPRKVKIFVTYDQNQFFKHGRKKWKPGTIKSNTLTLFIRPSSEKVEMPEVKNWEPRDRPRPR